MLVLFILILVYYFYVLRSLIGNPFLDKETRDAIILQFIIMAAIVLSETIAYWVIRKRIYRRLWANLHIISMYLALVATPFLFYTLRIFLPPSTMANVRLAQGVFFWLCVVAGHLCFIATIVKSFSRPQPEHQHGDNTANILDEFAE